MLEGKRCWARIGHELSSGTLTFYADSKEGERPPVSELMSAGQMSRGFSTELSYPRAQQNVQTDVCSPMCVYVRVYKLAELPCLRTSCINRTLSRGTVSSGPPPLAPDCKRRRAEECVCVCLMMSKKFTSSWAVGYVYVLCP